MLTLTRLVDAAERLVSWACASSSSKLRCVFPRFAALEFSSTIYQPHPEQAERTHWENVFSELLGKQRDLCDFTGTGGVLECVRSLIFTTCLLSEDLLCRYYAVAAVGADHSLSPSLSQVL